MKVLMGRGVALIVVLGLISSAYAATICQGYPSGPPLESFPSIQEANRLAFLDDDLPDFTVQGVVVADLRSFGENKFFIQAPVSQQGSQSGLSHGIEVNCFNGCSGNFAEGDFIQVTGTLTLSNFGVPQIIRAESVVLEATKFQPSQTTCPALSFRVTVVEVTLPLASLDSLRSNLGMLMRINHDNIVVTNTRDLTFGQIWLTANNILINPGMVFTPGTTSFNQMKDENLRSVLVLDDVAGGSCPSPNLYLETDVRNGWTLPKNNLDSNVVITSFVDDGVQRYHLKPNAKGREVIPGSFLDKVNPRFSRINDARSFNFPVKSRSESIAVAEDEDAPQTFTRNFRVAGMNMLNYFTTLTSDPNCNGCRGADTKQEFDLQRQKLFSAIREMDAAVLGLSEVENGGDAFLKSFVADLNNFVGSKKYSVVLTGGKVGTDSITNVILYQHKLVNPLGDPFVLEYTDPVAKSRPSVMQSFSACGSETEFTKVFTFVVTHLKSKGSGCDEDDENHPDHEFFVDGEGSCGYTRLKHVQQLIKSLAEDPTNSRSPNLFLVGDFNSYTEERSIKELEKSGFVNLGEKHVGSKRLYSFNFDGESGTLDYLFTKGSMGESKCVDTFEWHINADEAELRDYNSEYCSGAKPKSFQDNSVFRASDHDPILSFCSLQCEVEPESQEAISFKTAAAGFVITFSVMVVILLLLNYTKDKVASFATRAGRMIQDTVRSVRIFSTDNALTRRLSAITMFEDKEKVENLRRDLHNDRRRESATSAQNGKMQNPMFSQRNLKNQTEFTQLSVDLSEI